MSKFKDHLIAAKKVPQTPLTLPEWDRFLQLTRNLLEYPALAFSIPLLLRQAAINDLNDQPFLNEIKTEKDLLLLKFGMLVCNYFCRATKLPAQTREIIEIEFIKKQSNIVQQSQENYSLSGQTKVKIISKNERENKSRPSTSKEPELPNISQNSLEGTDDFPLPSQQDKLDNIDDTLGT